MSNHIPVLLNEAITGLNIKPDGIYVDLTLGRGGHSLEILKRLKKGKLIAVDQDIIAIDESKERLKDYQDKSIIVRNNFANIGDILAELGIDKVDGILMDLGVSSPQFDEGDRGFSYRADAKLDMRMDNRNPLTAEIIVNTYSLNELTKIFREYGEERFAYQIAKNIVKAREISPIITTYELVDIIKKSKPQKELKKVGHPAKQVFQALRIAVNDELNVLKKALDSSLKLLSHKGRLVIISFHSLEDRIVKNAFKEAAIIEGNRLDIGGLPEEKDFILITRKPITATEEEISNNNRSHSAKLRIIERK